MHSIHTARRRIARRIARRFAGITIAALAAALAAAAATPAHAQGGAPRVADGRVPEKTKMVQLSGPRFGFTILTKAMQDTLRNRDIEVGSVITQFGWQFEKQFLGEPGGIAAVNEWVLLVGGLDQGTFLPSLSWIVGLRTPGGAEIGVGPNLSPAGVGLVLAGGVTFRAGSMNIPLNVALVPTNAGIRTSIITGFTLNK